jgi:hypothetical protein
MLRGRQGKEQFILLGCGEISIGFIMYFVILDAVVYEFQRSNRTKPDSTSTYIGNAGIAGHPRERFGVASRKDCGVLMPETGKPLTSG